MLFEVDSLSKTDVLCEADSLAEVEADLLKLSAADSDCEAISDASTLLSIDLLSLLDSLIDAESSADLEADSLLAADSD